ncbi:hypothetical protein [Amycolatopsis panacis]|uniref:hypothetical protein n=1 Tax=Amycolatopsis panacis TaxID=2340917 RepID=UPI001F1B58A0|nr:hypothetical protein [Amycolatopsis panacis]
MGQALNTTVNGSSSTCVAAADWLHTVVDAGHQAAGSVRGARTSAEAGWHGPASNAFRESIDHVDVIADQMADWAGRGERSLRDFAASLDAVVARMHDALAKAAAGKLNVQGPFIVEPDPVSMPQPGAPVEVCTANNLHEKIGVYGGDIKAYNALVADYNAKVAVYNECKAIVDAARTTEGNAHHALQDTLVLPEGPAVSIDGYKVGTTTIARVNGYISSFENPRMENLLKAQRAEGSAQFFENWAKGTQLTMTASEKELLKWAADESRGNKADYETRAQQFGKYVEKVPEPVRKLISAYPRQRCRAHTATGSGDRAPDRSEAAQRHALRRQPHHSGQRSVERSQRRADLGQGRCRHLGTGRRRRPRCRRSQHGSRGNRGRSARASRVSRRRHSWRDRWCHRRSSRGRLAGTEVSERPHHMTNEPPPDNGSSCPDRLPLRPDPQSGEPFPPHGLSYVGAKQRDPVLDPNRETRLSYKPEPPAGLGPVLAWHRESRRGKAVLVLTGIGLMLVIVAGISLLSGDGLAAFGYWQMWVLVAVGTILMAGPFSYLTYAAGADWFMVERSRWGVKKRLWVDLYELKKIDVSYGGTTFHLFLYDKDLGLSRSFEELQRDRRIWDLIYNGILHSVAAGAQVSPQAIGVLKLNETPALRLRDSARSSGDE